MTSAKNRTWIGSVLWGWAFLHANLPREGVKLDRPGGCNPRKQSVGKERIRMKREEVKAKIPGITDDQLDWIMSENGTDVNHEKSVADQLRSELATANNTIKSLQETAKKFDGVDVEELKKQASDLQAKYDADIAAVRRDSAIELALAGSRAKNNKAARALLDMDAIKLDGDKLLGMSEQLEGLRKEHPWMFEQENDAGTGTQVNTGGEHGAGGGERDGVTAAFAALNPGLKL